MLSQLTNSAVSNPIDIPFSVPQGSVAGPVLFNCYSSTLAEAISPTITSPQQVNIIGYADDHSLYTNFRSGNTTEEQHAAYALQNTLSSVKTWMTENKLQMNDAKTEVIVFKSQFYNNKTGINSILVGDATVDVVDSVKLLGVKLDTNMSLKSHIAEKCGIASGNLNKIRRLHRFLDQESCKSVVLGLVISHIDYCNATLLGIPTSTLLALQSILNQAAQ